MTAFLLFRTLLDVGSVVSENLLPQSSGWLDVIEIDAVEMRMNFLNYVENLQRFWQISGNKRERNINSWTEQVRIWSSK